RAGRIDAALRYLEQARSIAQSEKDSILEARANLQLGAVYGVQGKYDRAKTFLERALKAFENQNDHQGLVDVYTNLGASAASAKKDQAALACHLKALTAARKLKDDNKIARCLLNTAFAYATAAQWKKAVNSHRDSLEIARRLQDRRLEAFNLYGIAGIVIDRDQRSTEITKAITFLDEAIAILTECGDRSILCDCLFKRAQAKCMARQDYRKDIGKAFDIAKQMGISWLEEAILSWKNQHNEGNPCRF
ncbi:tetratricopeptide repeat protein, partial [bacterium]|nr:tetratricopeptide repeat protein [candidate division CSSED10-310 bacterium]